MKSKWLKSILSDKDKNISVCIVYKGKKHIYNLVAVEDETDTDIILAVDQTEKS